MKFLANENVPLPSVRILQKAGYDVLAITEESPGIEDNEVLAWAVSGKRVILTFDRDYGELIYRLGLTPPSGVIYLRRFKINFCISNPTPPNIQSSLRSANRYRFCFSSSGRLFSSFVGLATA